MTTVEAGTAGGAPAAAPAGPPPVTVAMTGAAPEPYAAVPTLRLRAVLTVPDDREVRSMSLQAQVRIATDRRGYDQHELARLAELFGGPEQPHRPRPSLVWTHASVQVPAFTGRTELDIPVVCTYDFEVVAAKYLHALAGGDVPLELLFAGTVFYPVDGRLQAGRLPWDTEARFDLPVRVWQDLMDHYFPGTAWLRLDRDTFDALYAYRVRHTLTGWTETVRSLLRAAGAAA